MKQILFSALLLAVVGLAVGCDDKKSGSGPKGGAIAPSPVAPPPAPPPIQPAPK